MRPSISITTPIPISAARASLRRSGRRRRTRRRRVHALKEITPTQYSALFETKIAYIKLKFEVAVEMTRAERPNAIEAKIDGKPHGIVGRLAATATSSFVERDGGTAIAYA